MKTPKLLPWYARKAGVSTERATVLWRKAVRESTDKTGWVGNAEYWGEAMHSFQDLLAREERTLCEPDVTPFLRSQNRLWRLPMNAIEDICIAMSSNWQRNCDPNRHAT